MDQAGWASVDDVVAVTGVSRAELVAVVETNTKQRFELDGDRIRACQGHSMAGVPVTREALEASWQPHRSDALLWHGTSRGAVAGIRAHEIEPGARSHVHLAPALDSHVGRRSAVDVLLAVSPARLRHGGLAVYRAPNGVVLVRHVPPDCIVEIRPADPAGSHGEEPPDDFGPDRSEPRR